MGRNIVLFAVDVPVIVVAGRARCTMKAVQMHDESRTNNELVHFLLIFSSFE
jgi:hypothetical protein